MTVHPALSFMDLLGQEKAKRMLSRSLAANRVPHAYIFKGPAGVGRKLFARGFAAAINCCTRIEGAACGVCRSCLKLYSGNHPDFQLLSSEKGGIKIDQVRKLCRDLSYPPYESKMRVVVLEDVHAMRPEAANCLLKTLEEPPENNLIILTAESSREILSTLTSRCQVVPFSRLEPGDTETILQLQGVEPDEAQLLARLAEGSPGRALLLQKTEIVALWREVVTVLSVNCGADELDVGVVLKLAEKMAGLKEHLGSLLGLLRIWLRDLLIDQHSPVPRPESVLYLLQSQGQELKSWNSAQLFAKLRAIDSAEKVLARNCNRLLACEVLLFNLQ